MSIGNDTVDLGDDMGVTRSKLAALDATVTPPVSTTLTLPTPSDGSSSAVIPSPMSPPSASGSASASPSTPPAASATEAAAAAPPAGTFASPTMAASTLDTPASPSSSPSPQSNTSTVPSSRPSPRQTSSGSNSAPCRQRPASALVMSGLSTPLPKPRSNSSLQSSRPAPPSPANSRPASQIMSDSAMSPHVSPRASVGGLVGLGLASSSSSPPVTAGSSGQSTPTSAAGGRDRAGSTSSLTAGGGRRIRPRSTLGTSSLVPSSQEGELATVSEPYTPRLKGEEAEGDSSATIREVRESSAESESEQTADAAAAASATAIAPTTEAQGAASSSAATSPILALAATLVRRVIVRDYAYPCDDERFLGLGPTRPRSNWCEGEPEPEEPPAEQKSEGGWGGLALGLGWGFLGRRAEAPAAQEDTTDYTLASGVVADHDNDSYWSDDDDDDDELADGEASDPDGLYRAAYTFEPEGVNEMAVGVGDLLDVRGRGGGGDGWVVAIRLDTKEEGLVPEGYLERVDEDDCPEGWAHLRKRREASEERDRERIERERANENEEEVLIETKVDIAVSPK